MTDQVALTRPRVLAAFACAGLSLALHVALLFQWPTAPSAWAVSRVAIDGTDRLLDSWHSPPKEADTRRQRTVVSLVRPEIHREKSPRDSAAAKQSSERVDASSKHQLSSVFVAAKAFDVAPQPETDWWLEHPLPLPDMPHPEGAAPGEGPAPPQLPWLAVVELEVRADGQIHSWRVIRANIAVEDVIQRLKGLERTKMLPAVRSGKPVAARFWVEFSAP